MISPVHSESKASQTPGHLRDWYTNATVRSSQRHVLEMPFLEEELYFRPELIPHFSHPIIEQSGPVVERGILVHALLEYLNFTENLEHHVVNQVAYAIARDEYSISTSPETRLDAYRIYVDEAYHALFSADLRFQVEKQTNIQAIPAIPQFLTVLRQLETTVDPKHVEIVRLFFTAVSETLISANLRDLARDKRIQPPVRHIVQDHAQDEAIHHAFFADFLGKSWIQLSEEQRSVVGPLFPKFYKTFLGIDRVQKVTQLIDLGLDHRSAHRVIEESYSIEDDLERIRAAARPSIRHLRRHGLLQDPWVGDSMANSGLLPQE